MLPEGKGPAAPINITVNVKVPHDGEGGIPAIPVEMPGSTSLAKAKELIEKAVATTFGFPRGSIVFGDWAFKLFYPNSGAKTRTVRSVEAIKVHDNQWVVNLGIAPESHLAVVLDADGKRCTANWYTDVPSIPDFIKPPTAEELAAAAAAKAKPKKKK